MELIRHHTATNIFIEEVIRIFKDTNVKPDLLNIMETFLVVMSYNSNIPSQAVDYLMGETELNLDMPKELINIVISYMDYKCIITKNKKERLQLFSVAKLMSHYDIEKPVMYDFIHKNTIYTIMISKKTADKINGNILNVDYEGLYFYSFYTSSGGKSPCITFNTRN